MVDLLPSVEKELRKGNGEGRHEQRESTEVGARLHVTAVRTTFSCERVKQLEKAGQRTFALYIVGSRRH